MIIVMKSESSFDFEFPSVLQKVIILPNNDNVFSRIHSNLEEFKQKTKLCAEDAIRLFDSESTQDNSSGISGF